MKQLCLALALSSVLVHCQPALDRQPKAKDFTKESARVLPAGVVAHTPPVKPPAISEVILQEGRRGYDIHCSVCHGFTGLGDGMATERGFPHLTSFHTDELRKKPVDYFFKVISDGKDSMYGYANKIPELERWKIAYYVRALQVSRHFPASHTQEAQ